MGPGLYSGAVYGSFVKIFLYGYVLNDPVNLVDPYGLWSFGGSFYYGLGGFLKFGKNNGKWFVRGGGGVGLGGGLQWTPTDEFPGSSEDTPCGPEGFIGANVNVEASFGPLNVGAEGYAGGHITIGPDGRSQINYVENGGVEGSITGERGYGVKAEGSFNLIDVGRTW